jgi:2-amino-4-hydroxy-6-hydroxymethyldihydropteridine diphosphokinase
MNAVNHPIVIGLGANLPSQYGSPRNACGAALELLEKSGIKIIARSPWYESAPVPVSDQPWYVNGVIIIDSEWPPATILKHLLGVETQMGRQRGVRNAARIIDLDLIAYGETITDTGQTSIGKNGPDIPHPRMHERAFVVLPLRDLLPNWRHPASGQSVNEMASALPPDQSIRPMPDEDGQFGTEWKGENT